jgi:2-methylcitrate dehydratase PrpD
MGIAYHQWGGNGLCVKDGALTKRLGPGFSVRGGIVSALMAEKGVTGAQNVLEGEWGLYSLYFQGNYDADVLTSDLGKTFEAINVIFKPYPCCRGIHPAIDAALAIVRENNVAPDDVEEIVLTVTNAHQSLLCTPWEAKTAPRNPVDAQFSIPWGVATALSRQHVGLESFSETALEDKTILDFTSKMKLEVDPELERDKKCDPTRIRLTTRQNEVHVRQVEEPLGSLTNPMSYDDCAGKFKNCASGILPDKDIDAVIELIGRLEQLGDVEEILRHLCPA